jgi:hypothetical protein
MTARHDFISVLEPPRIHPVNEALFSYSRSLYIDTLRYYKLISVSYEILRAAWVESITRIDM